MSENTAAVVESSEAAVQEQKTAPVVKGKGKATNALVEIAQEVEGSSKEKALKRAEALADDIDRSFIQLGGYLKVIRENTWFEGYESYGAYVEAKFGFKERKALYLEEIYVNLVDKQIPWEKVQGLGWTKLAALAKVLTPENVDEWVAKATPLTVREVEALVKGEKEGEGESVKTTDQVQVLKFKLQNDQIATVQNALAKAKGELGTEFDTVALEGICSGFLGGTVSVASVASEDPKALIKAALDAVGWEQAFQILGEFLPPNIVVDVTEK